MLNSRAEKSEQIAEMARVLAEDLSSEEGKRALARAAEESRLWAAKHLEASRVDPQFFLKRVTF